MLRLRDQRLPGYGLAVVLLIVIGVAVYRVGVDIWTSRQYHAASEALERYDYSKAAAHLESYLATSSNRSASKTSRAGGAEPPDATANSKTRHAGCVWPKNGERPRRRRFAMEWRNCSKRVQKRGISAMRPS